jgi:Type I phosphodiesterase / nucleotide pyrophosphatase
MRLLFFLLTISAIAAPATRNVILVTADGLRWQEVFHGIDPLLAHEKSAGMEKAEDRRKKYERTTEQERREALMPFFWKKFAPEAAVFSNVKVTNSIHVSYPGYSEILTGRSNDAVIHGNDPIRNPNETVLEFVKSRLGLQKPQVALFASSETFRQIAEHTEGSIFINAGYQTLEAPRGAGGPTLRLAELSRMQFHALTPWDEARHDYFTGAIALEYMRAVKPRLLDVSFDETDDWAHEHRYDRVLDSIAEFDGFLERLWTAIENSPDYRGSTTVIVTADHGRGSTVADWSDHGAKIEGAGRIWLAIRGPDTPARMESGEVAEQRDIAPTILKLLGIDPAEYHGATGKVIPQIVKN